MKVSPPPVQVMAAWSSDHAAVRLCDGALATPTVKLKPFLESNVVRAWKGCGPWTSRTVTIPIVSPAGAHVLSVVIQIPKYDVWHLSILDPEGAVCFARIESNKPTQFLTSSAPVPIQWGGAHFGQVGLGDSKKREHGLSRLLCFDSPTVRAQGPTDSIAYAEDISNTRNKLEDYGVTFTLCFLGIFCFMALDSYPWEYHIKNRFGEKIGSTGAAAGCKYGSDTVVHLGDMTQEQRRLALAAVVYDVARVVSADPGAGGGG